MKKLFIALLVFPILSSIFSGCATMSPLAKAMESRDTKAVENILTEGRDIDRADPKTGFTPLHLAIYYGNTQAAKMLIERGAALEIKDKDGRTPLMMAIDSSQIDVVSLLIDKRANINAVDNNLYTPIVLACQNNDYDINGIKKLIEKGALLNVMSRDGFTPLISASYYAPRATVALLIKEGAAINMANYEGVTPLIAASYAGQWDIVELLIKEGAYVHAQDVHGNKASDYAKPRSRVFKRLFNSPGYEKNQSALNMLRDAEKQQPLKVNQTANIYTSKIFPIVGKVQQCLTPDVEYKVFMEQSASPNASVNLSGNITYTSAALDKWDDDILTFVTAHEIAHDKLGHVTKKLAVSTTTNVVMIVANQIVPGLGLLNHVIHPAIVNNFSKSQEYDADKLAAEACLKCFDYSIEKQVEIMKKIQASAQCEGGGFWATHPSWNDRIANIQEINH